MTISYTFDNIVLSNILHGERCSATIEIDDGVEAVLEETALRRVGRPRLASLDLMLDEDSFNALFEMEKVMSDKVTENGELWVSKTYKERGVIKKEENEEEEIQVKVFAHSNLATVKREGRLTINMGNFESIQIAVGVSLPCYIEELSEADEAAAHFVDTRLSEESSSLRAMRDSAKSEKKG